MFTILYFPIVNQKLGVSVKVVLGYVALFFVMLSSSRVFYLLRAEKNILG